jgi:hypothetical protein
MTLVLTALIGCMCNAPTPTTRTTRVAAAVDAPDDGEMPEDMGYADDDLGDEEPVEDDPVDDAPDPVPSLEDLDPGEEFDEEDLDEDGDDLDL